jgi:hypothetical protein
MCDKLMYVKCHAEVTRKGYLEPCDKPAVTVTNWGLEDCEYQGEWPVCYLHIKRYPYRVREGVASES